MSRDGGIVLDWGDDTYTFRLGFGEIEALQEACDAGPFIVLKSIDDLSFKARDLSHIIRLGLIGGGMDPVIALKKVRLYVEARPLQESILFARAILAVALLGPEDEPLGKPQAEGTKAKKTRSPTAKSA